MSAYYLDSEKVIFQFAPDNPAVITVPDGATITVVTQDCFANQLEAATDDLKAIDWGRVNPATGPIAIAGAKVGSCLKVEILDIRLNNQALLLYSPGHGPYGHKLKNEGLMVFPIKDNYLDFAGQALELDPMIGVIGCATNKKISSIYPGFHGGNLDCKEIRKNSTVYLPVQIDTALLALGDLHALMGDGESAGCGAECAGEVDIRVSICEEDFSYLPLVENNESLFILASGASLDEAVVKASENGVELLSKKYHYPKEKAISLISLIGDVQICQVVNPLVTVRLKLPKRYLN